MRYGGPGGGTYGILRVVVVRLADVHPLSSGSSINDEGGEGVCEPIRLVSKLGRRVGTYSGR